jgi:short-subunit dehydrogenase
MVGRFGIAHLHASSSKVRLRISAWNSQNATLRLGREKLASAQKNWGVIELIYKDGKLGSRGEMKQNIFIAGGTSGIGLGLAQFYLKCGHRVGLCGRDLSKLPASIGKYSNLQVYEADVRDKRQIQNAVNTFANGQLDIMFACAGSYANSRTHKLSEEESLAMIDVNISGTINTFEAAKEIMIKRQSGHIVAIASVAGLFSDSLYSATKRTIIKVGEAYQVGLSPFGISTSVIAPGYIDTEKLRTLNGGSLANKPFVQSLDVAVSEIVEAVQNKKRIHIFPWQMRLIASFLQSLPTPVTKLILSGRKQ